MPSNDATVVELFDTIRVLVADCTACAAALDPAVSDVSNADFWRRVYVRTSFSLLEGATARLSAFAESCRSNVDVHFTPVELEQLRGTSWNTSLLDRVELALRATAVVAYTSWLPRVPADIRRQFGKVKETRDRLTHPKSVADLNVSETDVAAAHEVTEWMGKQVADLMEAIPHTWARKIEERHKGSSKPPM